MRKGEIKAGSRESFPFLCNLELPHTHLSCDFPGQLAKGLPDRRFGLPYRLPQITTLTDFPVERNLAQQRQVELAGQLLPATLPEDFLLLAAVRAHQIAHVLDNPQYRRIIDLFFVEALAPGFARPQPNPDGNRCQDDQAVPTNGEMTDAEYDGIDAYGEHLQALDEEFGAVVIRQPPRCNGTALVMAAVFL
jgi:hypothetical protein